MYENKQKKRPHSIEELAQAIKFDASIYTTVELLRYKSDLAAKLLNEIHLGAFAKSSFEEIDYHNTQLEENYQYKKYSGESFTKAYKSSLEDYGKLDEQTGERIPYIKLFRSHYNFKKLDINSEKLKEQHEKNELKLVTQKLKLYLNTLLKNLNKENLPEQFLYSKKNVIKVIKDLNLEENKEQKIIDDIEQIYILNKVERVSGVIEENERGEQKAPDQFIKKSFENTINDSHIIDAFCFLVDKLYKEIEDNSLKQYVQYYITMKIILKYKLQGNINFYIDEYVDKDLEAFYYKKCSHYKEEKYIKDIIADYIGKKPDTVRKKIDRIQKIIQNNLLKSVSNATR